MSEDINKICNCKRKNCERFGKCDECIEHHKHHKRYPEPYCIRQKNKKLKKEANKEV